MKELVIFTYIVMTISTTIYTSSIMKQNEDKRDYIHEVHSHMASIMFFHATVISLVVYLKPPFLNNIYVSIINTCLSLMFSLLFYLTERSNKELMYIYNTCYLVFASVLVAEFILYFENDTFIYTLLMIFGMFLCDLVLFKEDRINKLLVAYGVVSTCLLGLGFVEFNYFYSVLATAIYGFVIIAYMYKDTEYLKSNQTNHLDDSLKYFMDIEGIIVRSSVQDKTE